MFLIIIPCHVVHPISMKLLKHRTDVKHDCTIIKKMVSYMLTDLQQSSVGVGQSACVC